MLLAVDVDVAGPELLGERGRGTAGYRVKLRCRGIVPARPGWSSATRTVVPNSRNQSRDLDSNPARFIRKGQ
jgi:hypothetical protein